MGGGGQDWGPMKVVCVCLCVCWDLGIYCNSSKRRDTWKYLNTTWVIIAPQRIILVLVRLSDWRHMEAQHNYLYPTHPCVWYNLVDLVLIKLPAPFPISMSWFAGSTVFNVECGGGGVSVYSSGLYWKLMMSPIQRKRERGRGRAQQQPGQ